MKFVVPATLLIIFALLYATFRRWDEVLILTDFTEDDRAAIAASRPTADAKAFNGELS